MIAARIAELARSEGSRIALRSGEDEWSYARLLEQAERFEERMIPCTGQQLGILGSDLPNRIGGLIAADSTGITPCLFPTGMNPESQQQWGARLGLVDLFDVSAPYEDSAARDLPEVPTRPTPAQSAPSLWLFTSGTTGPPKPVQHSWEALTAAVRTGVRYQNRRWLLAYDSASFAGLQVTLQALLTGGTLSDVSTSTPETAACRIVGEEIEFAAGTPTFWRMLLGAVDPATWRHAALEQITLGGEAVSAGTLAALKGAFPRARVSHIYATSELGICFSVADGRAGFPVDYLQNPPAGCQLRISSEGELEVSSTRRARTLEEQSSVPTADTSGTDWSGTGDLVEVRNDRVYFVGRLSGVIHVGGGKVVPEEVEAVVRNVPGVVEVLISGQASSVLGAIVRADVVAAPEADIESVRSALLAICHEQLPRHKVPAIIEFHHMLPRTPSGKLARSAPVE